MLTAQGLSEIFVVFFSDILLPARSEADDLLIGFPRDFVQGPFPAEMVLNEAPKQLSQGNPPASGFVPEGLELFRLQINHGLGFHGIILLNPLARGEYPRSIKIHPYSMFIFIFILTIMILTL
jgi:hypothetical protein